MAFVRQLDKDKITRLLDNNTMEGKIYNELLLPDIMEGHVFVGIRDNKVDFYAGGNIFFSYYGSSFKINSKIYGKSKDSKMISVNRVFQEGIKDKYLWIWKQCNEYASENREQEERKILKRYFPAYNRKVSVIVLDREIRLNSDGSKGKCDWLLYNVETRQLKFVEVKRDSHKCLRRHHDGIFDVISQLNGYSRQYEIYKDNIVMQYRKYVGILNQLLGLSLPVPEELLDTVAGLAIFVQCGVDIDKSLIAEIKPFIGNTSVKLTEIWEHFAIVSKGNKL